MPSVGIPCRPFTPAVSPISISGKQIKHPKDRYETLQAAFDRLKGCREKLDCSNDHNISRSNKKKSMVVSNDEEYEVYHKDEFDLLPTTNKQDR